MASKFIFLTLIAYIYASSSYADNRKLLIDYINSEEKHAKVLKTTLVADEEDFKLYNISFNSLKWLDESKVIDPIWHHNILVIVPDKVESDTCFYRISNGNRNEEIQKSIHPTVQHVSLKNNAVGIEIRNVPNQPIKFIDTEKPLIEDGIIAYGWDKYLKTGEMEYILRLPMLKAAYHGFRVAKKFLRTVDVNVQDYVAFGESKRGWVTWLLPLVDPSVKAILPSVIDVLNVQKSMKHHQTVYGDWSPVLKDYELFNIPDRMFGKKFENLMQIIDPFNYVKQITIPKLIINSANDQFFLPDNSQFYYDELVGEKRMMFLPNVGHQFELNDTQLESVTTYFSIIDDDKPIPKLSWEKVGNVIYIGSNTDIHKILVWQASNPKARDFRLWGKESPRYLSRAVRTKLNKKKYIITLKREKVKTHTATFVEAHYLLDEGPIVFTTEAFIN